MLQIAAIVAGLIAVVMGIAALAKGQVQLSRNKQLTGSGARAVGDGTVVVGVAIWVFALVGIPWLAGDPSIFSSTAASTSPAPSTVPEQPGNGEPQWGRHATPDRVCSAEFPSSPENASLELAGRHLDRLQLQREAELGLKTKTRPRTR